MEYGSLSCWPHFKPLNHSISTYYPKLLTCFISKWLPVLCYFFSRITHLLKHLPIKLLYFLFMSTIGFLILNTLSPRTDHNPRKIDLFFTSVSAATVSSMSTVEMETFSNAQLVVIMFLMFMGGEVLLSMVGLLMKSFMMRRTTPSNRVNSITIYSSSPSPSYLEDQIEMENIRGLPQTPNKREEDNHNMISFDSSYNLILADSFKFLGFLVLGYLLVFHILGISLVLLVTNLVSSAKNVLKQKGINQITFAIFTIVSTFSNCGFIPTNENMIAFDKNSCLLLILIPQILFGNTLFPSCLRFCIWVSAKYFKKSEAQYLLEKTKEIGYYHLLPGLHSWFLAGTVMGFLCIQFVLFCALEWNSAALSGLSGFERVVGVLFECVNSRHSGETVVDLSAVAPAMLVLFVVMMYLPAYTTFLPVNAENNIQQDSEQRREGGMMDNLLFSPISYLAVSIILICITERKGLQDDPLNFNILNVTFEVVSAYANVGFSQGHSCKKQLKAAPTCVDKWYGFAGKWSDEGKLILIVVMFYGRLKRQNIQRGKAWKLL